LRPSPLTGHAAVLSLFSAPSFAGRNQNLGAFAVVERDTGMRVHQFRAHGGRPTELPVPLHTVHGGAKAGLCAGAGGSNAFAWSLPILTARLKDALLTMLNVSSDSDDDAPPAHAEFDFKGKSRRFRRLCKLADARGLLPAVRLSLGADPDSHLASEERDPTADL